jgi:CBS domain-containing protein
MQLRDIMTSAVITAELDAEARDVAQLMRDHNVGSVVLCDPEGEPTAMVTDRDLTIRSLADDRSPSESVGELASTPLITGEPDMDLEEAAALMVQHRIRRLPVVDSLGILAGIVTLDDIAVRTGNLEVAQRMTQEVIEGALPGFFFHERG